MHGISVCKPPFTEAVAKNALGINSPESVKKTWVNEKLVLTSLG